MRTHIQAIIDKIPETAYIHGRLNAVRLCHLMRQLFLFFKHHPHLVPADLRSELIHKTLPETWEVVAAMRTYGRFDDSDDYQDFGRGINFADAGVMRCQAWLEQHNVAPEKAKHAAQAIAGCESDKPSSSLLTWLLKHATTLETLRDTRVKTIDVNFLPSWKNAKTSQDKQQLINLAVQHYRLIKHHQGFARVMLTADGKRVYYPSASVSSQRRVDRGVALIKMLGNQKDSLTRVTIHIKITPEVTYEKRQCIMRAVQASKSQDSDYAKAVFSQAKKQYELACENTELHGNTANNELSQAVGFETRAGTSIAYLTGAEKLGILPAITSDLMLRKQGFVSFYSAQRMWSGVLQMVLTQISKSLTDEATTVMRSRDLLSSPADMRSTLAASRHVDASLADTYCSDIMIAASVCPFDTKVGEGYLWALNGNRSFHERNHLSNNKETFKQELQKALCWPEPMIASLVDHIYVLIIKHRLPDTYLQMIYLPDDDNLKDYVTLCTSFGKASTRDSEDIATLSKHLKQRRIGDQVRINVSHPHVITHRFFKKEDREKIEAFEIELNKLLQQHTSARMHLTAQYGYTSKTMTAADLASLPLNRLTDLQALWRTMPVTVIYPSLRARINEIVNDLDASRALIAYLNFHNQHTAIEEHYQQAQKSRNDSLMTAIALEATQFEQETFEALLNKMIEFKQMPAVHHLLQHQPRNTTDYYAIAIAASDFLPRPKLLSQFNRDKKSFSGEVFYILLKKVLAAADAYKLDDIESLCLDGIRRGDKEFMQLIADHCALFKDLTIIKKLLDCRNQLTPANITQVMLVLKRNFTKAPDALIDQLSDLPPHIQKDLAEHAIETPNVPFTALENIQKLLKLADTRRAPIHLIAKITSLNSGASLQQQTNIFLYLLRYTHTDLNLFAHWFINNDLKKIITTAILDNNHRFNEKTLSLLLDDMDYTAAPITLYQFKSLILHAHTSSKKPLIRKYVNIAIRTLDSSALLALYDWLQQNKLDDNMCELPAHLLSCDIFVPFASLLQRFHHNSYLINSVAKYLERNIDALPKAALSPEAIESIQFYLLPNLMLNEQHKSIVSLLAVRPLSTDQANMLLGYAIKHNIFDDCIYQLATSHLNSARPLFTYNLIKAPQFSTQPMPIRIALFHSAMHDDALTCDNITKNLLNQIADLPRTCIREYLGSIVDQPKAKYKLQEAISALKDSYPAKAQRLSTLVFELTQCYDSLWIKPKNTGMSAIELLERLHTQGWFKAEQVLFKKGISGQIYTANDITATAQYCWGTPAYLITQRPELRQTFTLKHIIAILNSKMSPAITLKKLFGDDLSMLPPLSSSAEDKAALKLACENDNRALFEIINCKIIAEEKISDDAASYNRCQRT